MRKEFLRELIQDLQEASMAAGGVFTDTNADAMYRAAEKLYNVIDVLDIEP